MLLLGSSFLSYFTVIEELQTCLLSFIRPPKAFGGLKTSKISFFVRHFPLWYLWLELVKKGF